MSMSRDSPYELGFRAMKIRRMSVAKLRRYARGLAMGRARYVAWVDACINRIEEEIRRRKKG